MNGTYRASSPGPASQPPAWSPLERLRHGCGDAYLIEQDRDGVRGLRRDGLGDWIRAATAGELGVLISADYEARPVPREVAP